MVSCVDNFGYQEKGFSDSKLQKESCGDGMSKTNEDYETWKRSRVGRGFVCLVSAKKR